MNIEKMKATPEILASLKNSQTGGSPHCIYCRKQIQTGDEFYTDGRLFGCETCGLFTWDSFPESYYELRDRCYFPEEIYSLDEDGVSEFIGDAEFIQSDLEEMRTELDEHYDALVEEYGERFTDCYEGLSDTIDAVAESIRVAEEIDPAHIHYCVRVAHPNASDKDLEEFEKEDFSSWFAEAGFSCTLP